MKSDLQDAGNERTGAWPSSSKKPARDLTGLVLGDFRVDRLIGRGGMGEVYLAEQISLKRHVALKVLLPEWVSRPAYLSRFAIEATAVAKLNHPNIVQVYALGEADGVHYIAMEYVEGANLREYLIRKGSLDIPLALSIMRQSGSAVAAAGEVGLIHRDIKPENLLLTRKGRLKVADFGLCRDLEAEGHHVTQQGTTMGTPLYMSPEQAQGHAMDHRSDLYSLGVTYYHMIVGEPPFRADSALALALKHVREQPASLRVRRPDIPAELDRLVLKLIAKKPDDRYQSATEMLADLARVRSLMTTLAGSTALELSAFTSLPSRFAATAVSAPVLDPSSADPGTDADPGGEDPAPRGWGLGGLATMLGRGAAAGGRPRLLIALAALGLLGGGLLGWRGRVDERAAERGRLSATAPALGLGPRWSAAPRQGNAEEQYRHAQLVAPPGRLAAAWLAVPGYFPESYEWASAAYLQLGRVLYRERDGDRIRTLAREVGAWRARQTRDEQLVDVLETASDVLKRDVDGVIGRLGRILDSRDGPLSDPGLIDFCVELVVDALRATEQPGATGAAAQRPALTALRGRLLLLRNRVLTTDLAVR
ncbi:serine/threonine-protein kinase [Planctomyces sp. SH-PL62]|uniref:serine/threonine-protein kinase n=1 Tax=Planctomyces sp. SH-PL62 TaxID=1636152 RepID=UPI00078B8E96|nr:serine/threonine-protein kinase [Planctomyces sp. SH-PL62]AMV37572.1 Serine/threonine-protein kinase PknB [Planctomyces sp. SH-PL62]